MTKRQVKSQLPRNCGFPLNHRRRWISYRIHHTLPVSTYQMCYRSSPIAFVEAMLMAADEPIPIRRLAELLRTGSMTIAQSLVDQYRQLLRQTNSVYFLDVCQDRLKLYTRPDFLPWISRYLKTTLDPRLTPSMYEILAIIAHRQPIIRAEIENIRGSQSGDLLRQLLEKGLIRIVGRQESLGRPVEYGLAKKGLEFFGFNRIEELLAAFNSSTPTTP